MKERISLRDVPQELMTPMLSMGKYLKKTGLDEKLTGVDQIPGIPAQRLRLLPGHAS